MKRIHSRIYERGLCCLLFVAAGLYIEERIRPQVLYYWNPELFLKTYVFFRDTALLPGGIATYADKFLFQLNALPWLGTIATVSLALLSGVFANRLYSTFMGVRSSPLFTLIPLLFVLCAFNQFRILPLTKLLSALALADVFTRLSERGALFRVCAFLTTSCLFSLVVHDLYWFFTALCMLSTWARLFAQGQL